MLPQPARCNAGRSLNRNFLWITADGCVYRCFMTAVVCPACQAARGESWGAGERAWPALMRKRTLAAYLDCLDARYGISPDD